MTPQRIQLSRRKGWRMPENTVKVCRPGKWGNPFWVSRWRDPKSCVALFKDAMRGVWDSATSIHLPPAWNGHDCFQEWLKKIGPNPRHDAIRELRGKNLACWCPLDQPCHADVLLELANTPD